MSKVKSKGSKKSQPDTLTKVRDAAVAKPAQAIKATSQDLAKKVGIKEEKPKKKAKEPTPEPSSSEEEDDSDVASSAGEEDSDVEESEVGSSESESENEVPVTKAKPKANGVAKAVAKAESESSSSSSSDDGGVDFAPKSGAGSKKAPVAAAKDESDEEESDEEDTDESESDDGAANKKGPINAVKSALGAVVGQKVTRPHGLNFRPLLTLTGSRC